MNKKDLLIKMSEVADTLEKIGFNEEAKFITDEMIKVAQYRNLPMVPAPGVNDSNVFATQIEAASNALKLALRKINDPSQINNFLNFNTSLITGPFDSLNSNIRATLAPYEESVKKQKMELDNLIKSLSQSPNDSGKKSAIAGAINKLVSDFHMLIKRVQTGGQFKNDSSLFQRYVDWGQGKTVAQVYAHAKANNSENFANNLVSVLKASGLVGRDSVIPSGFKLNPSSTPIPSNIV